MTRFFQRGGAWVLGQGVLLAAVIVLAVCRRGGGYHPGQVVAGAFLMVAGAGVLLAGVWALRGNLTPFPKPLVEARLVQHGIYALIRHPLYTGVLLAAFGWAMAWQSWPALLAAGCLIPFFHAKALREERWLREKFPEYAGYHREVRRFIPWFHRKS